jgi:hypothetical protein
MYKTCPAKSHEPKPGFAAWIAATVVPQSEARLLKVSPHWTTA